jgi:hypothetical protein
VERSDWPLRQSRPDLSIFTNRHAQHVIARHVCECRQGIIEYPQREQIGGLGSMENEKRTDGVLSQPAKSGAGSSMDANLLEQALR